MGQELIQHEDIGSGYIHRLTNWRFQTTADRNDVANNFAFDDIDKLCFDMQTGIYYFLSAVNPSSGAPTWSPATSIAVTDPTIVTVIAQVSLSGHRVVSWVSASNVDLTDPTNLLSSRKLLGLTTQSATSGGFVNVKLSGELTDSSFSFTPNVPLWVGASGQLTQVYPTSGNMIPAGMALSATSIYLDFDTFIKLS